MEFYTDYTISWDFSDADVPTVKVSRMRSEGACIVVDMLGCSHGKSGVISLQQILNEWDKTHRTEDNNEQQNK